MSRKLRFEYPGALYHIINRGNYRSWIFESEGVRKSFEKPCSKPVTMPAGNCMLLRKRPENWCGPSAGRNA